MIVNKKTRRHTIARKTKPEDAPSDLSYIAEPLRAFAVPIDSVVLDPKNARKHGEENLKAIESSLRRFGQRLPIVVQRNGMVVRAGNGRVQVARKMGWTHIAAVVVEDGDEAATAFAILDNQSGALAEWDDAMLADLLKSLPHDLRIDLGFNTEALAEALSPPGMKVGLTDPDDVPEVPTNPITKTGDLWVLGGHRLLCGDSTKGDDVGRVMGDKTIDLCVTSPPYNCDISYDEHDDKMPVALYIDFITKVVTAMCAKLGKGRFVAWNVGVTPKSRHFDHARILGEAGLDFWRQIVWAKSGVAFPIWQYTTAVRKYHPNYTHEVIFLFSNGTPISGGSCDVDETYSKDVWTIHQSSATRDIPGESNGRKPRTSEHGGAKAAAHPAAYPVGIPVGCIKHLSMRGESVYEPFSGSGTTIIAAEQLGRRCYAIEISPQYVDVAVRRWEKFTGRKAERLPALAAGPAPNAAAAPAAPTPPPRKRRD